MPSNRLMEGCAGAVLRFDFASAAARALADSWSGAARTAACRSSNAAHVPVSHVQENDSPLKKVYLFKMKQIFIVGRARDLRALPVPLVLLVLANSAITSIPAELAAVYLDVFVENAFFINAPVEFTAYKLPLGVH